MVLQQIWWPSLHHSMRQLLKYQSLFMRKIIKFFLIGHNSQKFDAPFLDKEFSRAGISIQTKSRTLFFNHFLFIPVSDPPIPCSFLKLPLCLLFSNYPPLHLFFLSFFFLIFIFYILLLFVMYLFQIFFSMSMKFDSFLLITGIPLPELAFVDSLLGIHPLIVFYLSSS